MDQTKTFKEFFPELQSSKNHVIVILEEVFNRYYKQLTSNEEKDKFISDFSSLIKKSQIEHTSNVQVPLAIEKDKKYFISDYFKGDYEYELKAILSENVEKDIFSVDDCFNDALMDDSDSFDISSLDDTLIDVEEPATSISDIDAPLDDAVAFEEEPEMVASSQNNENNYSQEEEPTSLFQPTEETLLDEGNGAVVFDKTLSVEEKLKKQIAYIDKTFSGFNDEDEINGF